MITIGEKINTVNPRVRRAVEERDAALIAGLAAAQARAGADAGGHALRGRPSFCLGAVVNPGAACPEAELAEMAAKAGVGADFSQTQPVFEVVAFAAFLQRARSVQVPVLAGILLLKSARMARYMNAHVPEVSVPDWIIDALEAAPDPMEKGLQIALDTLRGLRPLCAGVHIMSVNGEEQALSLLDAAGL